MLTRILSLALCVFTFALVVLGGVVHATGASLACPDWPTCHGSLVPTMVGGVRFEHSHRVLAGLVVLLTLGLLFRGISAERRGAGKALRRGGVVALALVIVQALLGAATVLLRLPAAVSIAHFATAMSFFLTSIWLTLQVSPRIGVNAGVGMARRRRTALVAFACVGAQLLLGAIVRHTSSGLACLSFPGCDGPRVLEIHQWIQLAHRAGAGAVALGIALFAVHGLGGSTSAERRLVLFAIALVLGQIVLGMLSVISMLAVWAVTLHLALGALLLAVLWLDYLLLSVPQCSVRAAPPPLR